MRIKRNTRTGTENTTKNQSASPPAHRGRTKIGWRAAMCLLVAAGLLCLPRTGLGQTIKCGQTVTGTTTSPSQSIPYSYAGSAGQMLKFGFWWSDCTGGCADVYGPGDQLVGSVSVECSGGELNLTLPSTGTYTILVHSCAYNSTGSYALSLQSLTGGGCNSRPIVCGQTESASTSINSQMDAYGYAGSAGQALNLAFWWSDCTGGGVNIYDPSGQWVTNVSVECGGSAANFTLASTGTYTILVHSWSYNSTGNYTLSLTSFGGCAQLTVDESVIRTQQVGCLNLELRTSSPAAWLSFAVQAPGVNPAVYPLAPFTNAAIVPGTNSEWLVTMSASSGVTGDQIIGSLCFTPQSTQSVFAPVNLTSLVITNENGTVPGTATLNGRAVIIANQSLLQAGLMTNKLRTFTLYGKASTDYTIDYSTNLARPWVPVATNTLPLSASNAFTVQGSWSNAPLLLIRAKEGN
jgi:hypothetical protein